MHEFVETFEVKSIKAFSGQAVDDQQAEHYKHYDLLCSVASERGQMTEARKFIGTEGWMGRVGGKGQMKSSSCGLICPM